MKEIRWTCKTCGAIHRYVPTNCCRCGDNREEKEEKTEITFDNLMDELEERKNDDKT